MDDRVLVLGIGNLLMGDEGVGVHAIGRLRRETWPKHVVIEDGGTGGFHLLSFLQDYSAVVMIDATASDDPPGTVSVLRPRYASDFPRSLTAHDIGLRDLVEAAAITGTLPDIVLITVAIPHLSMMRVTLSPEVEQSLPVVAGLVRSITADGIMRTTSVAQT